MRNERILNNYYNKGEFNHPRLIGYMVNMLRQQRPLTPEEWRIWYLENVHNDAYLDQIAADMHATIPPEYGITVSECREYIDDVMFRRTFEGVLKEKAALKLLREQIGPNVYEAPKEWDTEYFIDFYIGTIDNPRIGIQLKPDTFFRGHYQYKVDIRGKMEAFRNLYGAKTFILQYRQEQGHEIHFVNPEVIDEIKQAIS